MWITAGVLLAGKHGMETMWAKTLSMLEEKVEKTNVETWVKPVRPLALRDQTLHLEAPSALYRDWINGNLLRPLEETLTGLIGCATSVIIHVGRKPQGDLFPAEPCAEERPCVSVRGSRANLIPHYTF